MLKTPLVSCLSRRYPTVMAILAIVCLLGAILPGMAFAQTLVVQFDTPDVIVGVGTSQVSFFGTVTNNGSETLNLDGDSNLITPDLPITSHFFDSDFPTSLAAGESASSVHFFDIDTSLAFPDVYTGSYQILATGATSGTSITSGVVAYTVTVVVPEAGSGLLFASSVFLFAYRHRRT